MWGDPLEHVRKPLVSCLPHSALSPRVRGGRGGGDTFHHGLLVDTTARRHFNTFNDYRIARIIIICIVLFYII